MLIRYPLPPLPARGFTARDPRAFARRLWVCGVARASVVFVHGSSAAFLVVLALAVGRYGGGVIDDGVTRVHRRLSFKLQLYARSLAEMCAY